MCCCAIKPPGQMLSGVLWESCAGLCHLEGFYLRVVLVLSCCTAIISAPHHPRYMIIISAPLYQQRVNKHNDRIQVAMTLLCHLCGEEGGKTWLYNCLVPVTSSGKRNSTVLTYFGAGVPES